MKLIRGRNNIKIQSFCLIVNEIGLRSGSISAVNKLRLSLGSLKLKQLDCDLDMSFLSCLLKKLVLKKRLQLGFVRRT